MGGRYQRHPGKTSASVFTDQQPLRAQAAGLAADGERMEQSIEAGTKGWSGTIADPVFAIGRERRLNARAYHYWLSLRDGAPMPRLSALDPERFGEFAQRAVLIDLSRGGDAPAITHVGGIVRRDSGALPERPTPGDVPVGSVLRGLLDRLNEVIAYNAPIGFQSDGESQAEVTDGPARHHRGILLPFCDEGGTISAVLGIIGWHDRIMVDGMADIAAAVGGAMRAGRPPAMVSPWATPRDGGMTAAEVLEPPTLEQRLGAAKTWSALAIADRTGGMTSLHAALGAAHDLLLAARDQASAYAALTGRQGTPSPDDVVQLAFGPVAAARRRLAYRAVVAHAGRLGLGIGQLTPLLDRYEGGAAAFAAAERHAARSIGHHVHAMPIRSRTRITLKRLDETFLLPAGVRADRQPAVLRKKTA